MNGGVGGTCPLCPPLKSAPAGILQKGLDKFPIEHVSGS